MIYEIFSPNFERSLTSSIKLIESINESEINLRVNSLGLENVKSHENSDLDEFVDLSIRSSHKKKLADEMVILDDLLNMSNLDLREVFKGAHIRIKDNGFFFEKWKVLRSARERISSHPSVLHSKQYGIAGPTVKEFLFGIVQEGDHISTFFQLEKTPWGQGLRNCFFHAVDAVKYVLLGKNIGPHGNSIHTDKKPIIIENLYN